MLLSNSMNYANTLGEKATGANLSLSFFPFIHDYTGHNGYTAHHP